ncbi:MAG: hypothetical protein FWD65_07735 [Coriobacteriia bacterium]|nr:hypothetical protein [Coriobacteriia bacterium]
MTPEDAIMIQLAKYQGFVIKECHHLTKEGMFVRKTHHWGLLVGPILAVWAIMLGYYLLALRNAHPGDLTVATPRDILYLGLFVGAFFTLIWPIFWRVTLYNYKGSVNNWSLRSFRDGPLSHTAPQGFSPSGHNQESELSGQPRAGTHDDNPLPQRSRRGGLVIVLVVLALALIPFALLLSKIGRNLSSAWPIIALVGAMAYMVLASVVFATRRWRFTAPVVLVGGIGLYLVYNTDRLSLQSVFSM